MAIEDQASSVANFIGTAITPRFSVGRMGTDLSEKQNAHARVAIRAIIAEKFEGNASAFARWIGRSQPTISDFLSGQKGLSYATVKLVANKCSRTLESLLGPEEGRVEVDVERDAAIQAAGLLGFDKGAIARVLADNKMVAGRSRRWWFAQLQVEDAESAPPSRAARKVKVVR